MKEKGSFEVLVKGPKSFPGLSGYYFEDEKERMI